MLVGACQLEFFLPGIHSLKEKRRILLTIKEKTSHHFKVPVMEVGLQELWQRAQVGFAVAGSDQHFLSSLMDQMIHYIERLDLAQLTQKSVEILEL